jgi:hypothetical protein
MLISLYDQPCPVYKICLTFYIIDNQLYIPEFFLMAYVKIYFSGVNLI